MLIGIITTDSTRTHFLTDLLTKRVLLLKFEQVCSSIRLDRHMTLKAPYNLLSAISFTTMPFLLLDDY